MKEVIWFKKLKRKCFTHMNLVKELDADEYCNFLRMNEDFFLELLGMVKPYIEKKNTVMSQRHTYSFQHSINSTITLFSSSDT